MNVVQRHPQNRLTHPRAREVWWRGESRDGCVNSEALEEGAAVTQNVDK